jgi:hypothetical protein
VVSAQSIQNLTNVFERAARATILRSPDDTWEIIPEPAVAVKGDRLMIITTSSFAFRLLTIFHVADNEANRAYFLPAGADAGTLQEGFAEMVNMCCGALNREISTVFPHLGMSVPSSLSAECIDYLPQLNPEHTSRFTVSINGTVKVDVTLCMCCSTPIDIPVTLAAPVQAVGELEMF